MCFGVKCRRCGLEYASQSLSSLVAQRWRVLDPRHMGMLYEIVQYFRRARQFLQSTEGYEVTLGGFLSREGFSSRLTRHFVLPMGGAIWSASFADMMDAPARTILQFYENHGLLAASGAPPWRTVTGGSRTYVEAMARAISGPVHVGMPVERIVRLPDGVEVHTRTGAGHFDCVVIATHADTALALLADPSPAEQEALGAFRYSVNRTVLHTDASVLPRTRRAWASWNCDIHDCRDTTAPVSLTYHLNRLQGVSGDTQYCVTLNGRDDLGEHALAVMDYTHPVLDRDGRDGTGQGRGPERPASHVLLRRAPSLRVPRGRPGVCTAGDRTARSPALMSTDAPAVGWLYYRARVARAVRAAARLPVPHLHAPVRSRCGRRDQRQVPPARVQPARPVSLYDADHFDGRPLREGIEHALVSRGHAWPGGRVLLLTHGRVAGYVFNPVSFFYCFDRDDRLSTVVAEVNNTYGERHVYVLPAGEVTGRSHKKEFHVSPFFGLEGTYRFAVEAPDEALRIGIDLTVGTQRRFCGASCPREEASQ